MTNHTDSVPDRLRAGDDPTTIAEDIGGSTATLSDLDYRAHVPLDENLVTVVLPGYVADDGNCEVDYPDAASDSEAAHDYVDAGDWGDRSGTMWVDVWAWRRGYVLDPDTGDVEDIQIDRDCHTVTLEPEEPKCAGDEEHDWQSPYEVVHGIRENPGVYGHGGGVIITEVCRHCGAYRVTDTWAQKPDTGEQGLRSVEYRDPDEVSRAWIAEADA